MWMGLIPFFGSVRSVTKAVLAIHSFLPSFAIGPAFGQM
jgi:hypothetical protein